MIPGHDGRSSGGQSPTLGVIGRLGGLGARPARIGFVSDGDGALVALAVAAKLGSMRQAEDRLPGDVLFRHARQPEELITGTDVSWLLATAPRFTIRG